MPNSANYFPYSALSQDTILRVEMRNNDQKRVLLILPVRSGTGEKIRLGVYRYARPTRPWDFLTVYSSSVKNLPYQQINRWKPQGCIYGITPPHQAREVANKLSVPLVSLYGGSDGNYLPQVGVSDQAIGVMAATHLLECRFEHFGFFGLPDDASSQGRCDGFRKSLADHKQQVDVLDFTKAYPVVKQDFPAVLEFDEMLHRWLAWLAKPVAIFAFNDTLAFWASSACQHLGLSVPEEVAILGVNNEQASCLGAFQPLSSIRLPAEQLGRVATKTLDQLMTGDTQSNQPVFLQPMGVRARASTNILNITDPLVAQAVRYIRDNAHHKITVIHVLDELLVSRRNLEQRFKNTIGRTPFAEIRRVQIETAKQLLSDSDMRMKTIASQAGFCNSVHLSREFKRIVGKTPTTYRNQFRRM